MTVGDTFTIGPYTIKIVRRPHYCYWIEKVDGEAMGITEEKLIELLDKFWKEYF